MPIIPLREFGKYGVIHDTQNQALPFACWSNALNVRFTGVSLEKMLDPVQQQAWGDQDINIPVWMQTWSDGLSSYLVVATESTVDQSTLLWFWRDSDGESGAFEVAGGPYGEGRWQSFAWGNTCIFNNGSVAPQIFNPATSQFEDLPNWGLISSSDDIAAGATASINTNAKCVGIFPYKNFLVAIGITESGLYRPNTVWWSDATDLAGFDTGIQGTGGPPSWDYETPATLSGKSEVGVGDGALKWAAVLNESLICYTDNSASALQAVGGTVVMDVRRLFNKGVAGMHCAAEFQNQHYCVSKEQIYIHDGSTVKLIAKDRVEEEFFKRAGKGGRFNNIDLINYDTMQVIKNPDRKEVIVCFDAVGGYASPIPTIDPDFQEFKAVQIYRGNDQNGNYDYANPEGMFGVEGNDIMVYAQRNELAYSGDAGATWTACNMPTTFKENCNQIIKGPAAGAWFMVSEDPFFRTIAVHRTLDNGQSWVNMSISPVDQYTSSPALIDDEGRLVVSGRDGIIRFDTPLTSTAYNSYQDWTGAGTVNIDNMKLLDDNYVCSLWRGSGLQDVRIVNKNTFNTFTDVNYNFHDDVSDYMPWSTQFKGADDSYLYLPGNISELTTQYIYFDGAPIPMDAIDYGYNEVMYSVRTNSSDQYVLSVGLLEAEQNRWLCHQSYDGVTFLRTFDLELPHAPSRTRYQHIAAEGSSGAWIGAYQVQTRFDSPQTPGDLWETVYIRFWPSARPARRMGLVWNFDDDNYTWMDLSTDNADGENMDDTTCIHYGFDAGYQTRWSDLQDNGDTWQSLTQDATKWSDFYSHGREQNMMWLSPYGVYRADQGINEVTLKEYSVERIHIDLDDLVTEWTTNKWKHLKQFYFHAESPRIALPADNSFNIRVGWSKNLMDTPDWNPSEDVSLQTTTNDGRYKWDFRTAGRYLAIQMRFNRTNSIKMSGGDMDAEESHGR